MIELEKMPAVFRQAFFQAMVDKATPKTVGTGFIEVKSMKKQRVKMIGFLLKTTSLALAIWAVYRAIDGSVVEKKVKKTQNSEQDKKDLIALLKPYDHWANDCEDVKNDQAREALKKFYYDLKKIEPDKEYADKQAPSGRMVYIHYLINIRTALTEKKYERACNEIISLDHYDLLFQGRYYYNLIDTLKELLQIEE